ncbi:MAG: hypothetical protein R2855_10055 [Thermomicrobiales bacterium]
MKMGASDIRGSPPRRMPMCEADDVEQVAASESAQSTTDETGMSARRMRSETPRAHRHEKQQDRNQREPQHDVEQRIEAAVERGFVMVTLLMPRGRQR